MQTADSMPLSTSTTVVCRAEETLFHEHEQGEHMYIVQEGVVEIYVGAVQNRIPVARFTAGDFFGEMSLLEKLPRSGTAVAIEDAVLLKLDEDAFKAYIAEDHDFGWRVMKALSSRIRHHNRELVQRIGGDLQEISEYLGTNAKTIHEGIAGIAAAAAEIGANEVRLAQQIQEIEEMSRKMNSSLGFLQQVAQQTNILGLNAGIEAARSGEYGRGFQVVAQEIRHLSIQSKEHAKLISELTSQIEDKISSVANASSDSAKRGAEQAASTETISHTASELRELSVRLEDLAATLRA